MTGDDIAKLILFALTKKHGDDGLLTVPATECPIPKDGKLIVLYSVSPDSGDMSVGVVEGEEAERVAEGGADAIRNFFLTKGVDLGTVEPAGDRNPSSK